MVMKIGILWPKWAFSAKMATNGAEITRVNFDDFFHLFCDAGCHTTYGFGEFQSI